MNRTNLLTRLGHLVTTIAVPPFTPPVEIIIWGARYFVFHPDKGEYREGIAWTETDRWGECIAPQAKE